MRPSITAVILLLGICVPLISSGQKRISIPDGKYSVVDLLPIISSQCKLTESYASDLLSQANPVTISGCKNKTLEQVLEMVCKDQPFTYVIDEATFTFVRSIDVRGSVVNDRGLPITDAYIIVRGAPRRFSRTDVNGVFEVIKIPSGASLVFSAEGNNSDTLSFATTTSLTVRMTPIVKELSQVTVNVSTGVGGMPATIATGAFSPVSSDLLILKNIPTFQKAIEGLMPGVLDIVNRTPAINQPQNVQVGPRVTLNGNPDALIIVDKMPYYGKLADINLNDVLSVVVLKDAVGAAIWGARAAAGVIVITLKSGRYAHKLRLTTNSYVSFSGMTRLSTLDVMGPAGRTTMDTFLFNHGYTGAWERGTRTQALSPGLELLIKAKLYPLELSADQAAKILNEWSTKDVRAQMKRLWYEPPVARHSFVDMTGGSGELNFRLSAGFDEGLTPIRGSRDERKTGSIIGNWRPYKNLFEMTVGLNGARHEQRNTGKHPVVPSIYSDLVDVNGEKVAHPFEYRQAVLQPFISAGLLDWSYYPMEEFDLRNRLLIDENLRANFGLSFKAPGYYLRGLEVSFYTQYQKATTELREIMSQNTYYVRGLVNRLTVLGPGGPVPALHLGDILSDVTGEQEALHHRWQISFIRQIFGENRLSVMAGWEGTRVKDSEYSKLIYGYSETTPDGQSGIYAGASYPASYPEGSTYTLPAAKPSRTGIQVLHSRFASVGLQWHKQWNLSITARVDQSNSFGRSINNDKIPLFSAGLSRDLHLAPFLSNEGWISQLKARATYGTLGNIAANATVFPTVTPLGTSPSGDRMAYVTNPLLSVLQWETLRVFNFGLDFKFFKNLIGGSLDFSRKNAHNLIGDVRVDPTVGDVTLKGNTGKMKAYQFDMSLIFQHFNRKQFRWSTNLVFTAIGEKVTKYPGKLLQAWQYCDNTLFTIATGQAPYSINSVKSKGLDNKGNPIGFLKGQESDDYVSILTEEGQNSLIKHGRSTPGIFGSLSSVVTWREFSLNVAFLYKFKYYYRRRSIFYTDTYIGTDPGSSDFDRRWQKPGDENITDVPSMVLPEKTFRSLFYRFSDKLVERGDHLRLQFIGLSYSPAPKVLDRFSLSAMTINIGINNLGILWKASDKSTDPDYQSEYKPRSEYTIGVRVAI